MPSSKGYVRNYKQEAANETPARKKQRAERMAARRLLEKEGKVHKFDHKQVDHIHPLSMGGSNDKKNLRVRSTHANESYHRTSSGKMKFKDQS